jgi:hypothetical protein
VDEPAGLQFGKYIHLFMLPCATREYGFIFQNLLRLGLRCGSTGIDLSRCTSPAKC